VDEAQQQQQRQAQQADAESAAGDESAGGGTAQGSAGDDLDAEVAAGVEAAGGMLDHEHSNSNPQEGSKVESRLEHPVAEASGMHVAANSKRDTAGSAQQVANAADKTTSRADAAAEPERKHPRQQQIHPSNATDADVGENSGGLDDAAGQMQKGTTQTAGQENFQEELNDAELAVDQEDYNDADVH
jgi:hypothetical protein